MFCHDFKIQMILLKEDDHKFTLHLYLLDHLLCIKKRNRKSLNFQSGREIEKV